MHYDMPKEQPDLEAPGPLEGCARRGLVPLLTSTALREDRIADSPDFRRHSLFETFQHRYLVPLGLLGHVETSRARAVFPCECNNIGICPVREQSPAMVKACSFLSQSITKTKSGTPPGVVAWGFVTISGKYSKISGLDPSAKNINGHRLIAEVIAVTRKWLCSAVRRSTATHRLDWGISARCARVILGSLSVAIQPARSAVVQRRSFQSLAGKCRCCGCMSGASNLYIFPTRGWKLAPALGDVVWSLSALGAGESLVTER